MTYSSIFNVVLDVVKNNAGYSATMNSNCYTILQGMATGSATYQTYINKATIRSGNNIGSLGEIDACKEDSETGYMTVFLGPTSAFTIGI